MGIEPPLPGSLISTFLDAAYVLRSCLGMRKCRLKAAAKWDKWSGRLQTPWLFGCLEAMLSKDGSSWVLKGKSPRCSVRIWSMKWCVSRVKG